MTGRRSYEHFVLETMFFVKNFGAGSRWLPGEIVEMSGPVLSWRMGDVGGVTKTT